MTRIAIDCLNCGHCTSVAEEKLPAFGLEPKASFVTLTKRLVCKVCGSKSVEAFRYVEDADGPTWCRKNEPSCARITRWSSPIANLT
jgi:hypothetical protein